MKKILGLDLGTNSIGWALVEHDFENKQGEILGMGSRIIPMDAAQMGNFDAGNSVSQTAERTGFRGHRRLYERCHLRRERLIRVLNVLGFLPEHYAEQIEFDVQQKRIGHFKYIDNKKELGELEPKIAWKENQFGKFDFVFVDAFNEMIAEFRKSKPELFYTKQNGEETKIPYDWTIYYLRKKALSYKITKEELAWMILNFNQKRGYYQLRGEEDEKTDTKEYCALLKIVSVEKGEQDKKNDKKTWYKMTFENGWEYSATFVTEPNWLNTEREFLITEEYEGENIKIVKDKKSDTTGKEKRKITPLPSFDEINLMSKEQQDKIYKKIKARTEITITNSGSTVGTYIYETLLQNPTQKIRGKLVRTIERKFYRTELEQILKKQIELHPELFTEEKFNNCVRELYKNNVEHQNELNGKNFLDLFVKDIIFYQRPLRSQKSNIGNCALEFREHKINKKDENGNPIKNVFKKDADDNDIIVKEYLKGCPKSNPYYQEFRVWQWLYNLKIHKREDDKDVTNEFIKGVTDLEKLFEFLMTKKEAGNKDIIEFLIEENSRSAVEQQIREQFPKLNDEKIKIKVNSELTKKVKELLPKYRWNYVFDNTKEKEEDKSKKYLCNSTGYEIRRRLKESANMPDNFLKIIDTKEVEITKKNEQTGKREKTGEKQLVSLDTREYQLWHIIYSVTDKKEYEIALKNFAEKYNLNEASFFENFKNFKPFKSEYGSFSEKAIKKLLPLMRLGKYWNWENIDEKTKDRISKIITGEYDENIKERVRQKTINLTSENDFQGLQLWLAQYIVYDRHSEADIADKWKTVADLEQYLADFKQHSLRNPIVEQVITETLRVVRDIWKHYGQSAENFFDEIHIELGREMKNTAEDRAKITKQVSENENTNLRIKAMLMEFANDASFKNQTDYSSYCKDGENPFFYKQGNNPVRPYSQTQHDILKIYEEYVLNDHTEQDLKNEKTGLTETKDGKSKELTIYDISQKSQPTKTQIEKYKLWLEQQYRSPYTGQMISLTKLFTPAYEIEHIIPKSRYFDDSFNNKVICEFEVNKLKNKCLGLEFIRNNHGQIVDTGFGGTVKIFEEKAYQTFVKEHYAKNNAKRRNLLLEEIPDKMIERQMNDTRHISKFISNLLSNIVRAEKNDDGVNSKNIVSCNGKITTTLKQDWGLNDIWNDLILPRFGRMEKLTKEGKIAELENELKKKKDVLEKNKKISEEDKKNQIQQLEEEYKTKQENLQELLDKSNFFLSKNKNGKDIPDIPLELSKGFQKKRIDHRHHAMDALAIAFATRDHVNLLNNQHAKSENSRYDLQYKLRNIEKWSDKDGKERDKFTEFKKPYNNFTADAKNELEKIVVSFKQNLRVINKATNYYQKYENGKKVEVKQEGTNWAIRKPLHEETISGIVTLSWVKTGKNEFTTATRKALDKSFNLERISKITDTGIQKILTKYIENKENNPELAFSPEGLEELNKKISQYNDGKSHQSIFKVRVYEKGSGRFILGNTGNKKRKYVQGSPNLFYAVYENAETKKRMFETIPLNEIIEHQKQQVAENISKENKTAIPIKQILEDKSNKVKVNFLCYLSPNDLIYVPTAEERENKNNIDFKNLTAKQKKRLFIVNDFSDKTCYFKPNQIAKNIAPKEVDLNFDAVKNKLTGSFDTKTASFEGVQIKDVCIKLKIDRLGRIVKF